MPTWNGVPIPEPPKIKIPSSIPQNFNWSTYASDPSGTFNKFKGARETHRLNWKGYRTAAANTKKAILSSPSKKVLNAAMQQVRSLRRARKTAEQAKKIADATKKAADISTKVQEALFKNVPGSAVLDKASRVGGILGILAAIGVVALVKLQEFVSSKIFDNLDSINNELTKINTTATNNGLKLKTLDAKLHKFERELDANAKDYYRLNKQADTIAKNAIDAKKQANDALYETREGRKIVTGLAEAARKLGNDALYEARQNKVAIEAKISEQRISFDAKIQSINAQIAKFNNSVSDSFQKSVNAAISSANATISKIQSDLAATRAQVNAIKPSQPIDTNSITANAVAAARALVTPLQSQIGQLAGTVIGIQGQVSQIPVLAAALGSLAQNLNAVDAKSNAAMNEARNKGVPNLGTLQQQLDDKFNQLVADNNKSLGIKNLEMSNLFKEFEQKNKDFQRQSNLTADQRYQEFVKENIKTLTATDLKLSELSQEFDRRNADFFAQSTRTSQENYERLIEQNKQALAPIKSEIGAIKSDLKTTTTDLTKIDTKLKEQTKVNEQALPKLDQILGILPFIPARAADAIRPDIPTIPQIETAAATGTCRTTQPGGCMNKALKDNAADIANNNNTNAANILDAVNTGANAALLAGQQTILQRLGDQLPGGIGGKLSRFADWMHLDRVLNILILAATIHNALMLSNDIGQTLIGAINNVLQLIGLKKEDGSAFDIGSVISSSIENLIKGAIGAENYQQLTTAWAKANRIYQATTNVLNSFQNLTSTVLNGLELVAGQTGKIGNALRASGEVLESAYQWMNPQPKINRVTNFLEGLQNGASTIQQVTQVPLDTINAITELQTANTDFIKAIKEDDKPENKSPIVPEPDKLAADKATAKEASKGLELLDIDLEADE